MPGVVPVPIMVSSLLSLSRPTMSKLTIMTVSSSGIERVLDVVPRAEQAALLAREGDEDDAAGERVGPPGEPAGHLHDQRRARGVVVGPVVDVASRGGRASPRTARRGPGGRSGRQRRRSRRPAGPAPSSTPTTFLVSIDLRSMVSWASSVQPFSSRECGLRSASICFSRSSRLGWPAGFRSSSAKARREHHERDRRVRTSVPGVR